MNSTPLCTNLHILRHVSRFNYSFSTIIPNLISHAQKPALEKTSSTKNLRSSQYKPSSLNNLRSPKKESRYAPKKVSSKESDLRTFLSSGKNDPDNFGTLSNDWQTQQRLAAMPDEEDDKVEKEFLHNREGKTRLTTNQYGKIIKEFIRQKKIGLAIDVLETRMIKEDRVKPENYIYNLLIGACGQVGYTKKAFELCRQMRMRGLKVTGHTYTGLLNACANCPFPEEGLGRAQHLRGLLMEKGVLMNKTIYHAMIKAFGRCGDLETAFMLVDEMVENKMTVWDETFNFLLQACITDKEAGFRHALLVWCKMSERRVRPSLYSFNLLLRCSRDCGLGGEEASQQVIQTLLQSGLRSKKTIMLNDPSSINKAGNETTPENSTEMLPNLILRQPTMGSIVAVNNITKAEHRLMLMGGAKGVLEQMRQCRATPDIKTFTQLLDQLPSTLPDEQELVAAVKDARIALDVDFCNMLIRKRCLRKDYESAKDVLKIIQAENLRPDILTFGVLAMACQSLESALQLLQDIENVGFRPNVEILGTLLKNACFRRDCDFVVEIMKTLEKEGLKPNDKFLSHLYNFYRFSSKALSEKDTDDTGTLQLDKFAMYCKYYQKWRKKMNPDELPHPWNQFRETRSEPEDLEIMNRGKVKFAS